MAAAQNQTLAITQMREINSEIDKVFRKSLSVGVIELILASIYLVCLVGGAQNDNNIGFWLYGPVSMFFLWPYQVILALKLRSLKAKGAQYLGVILTLFSLVMTIGMW